MNDLNKELLKKMVQSHHVAFQRYFDGNLWYQAFIDETNKIGPEFPVPISDIGNATFLAVDKSMLFMRYMRKHLEMLEEAEKHPYA